MNTNNKTVTFWRQPGDKTFKRTGLNISRHFTPEEVSAQLVLLSELGFTIDDQGHKIVCTANA